MANQTKTSTGLNITTWALQALMALLFLMGGLYNISQPIEVLAPKMSYVNYFPIWAVKLIAASEVLGAIGLLLPDILRIKTILTPLAALGLALVMLFATIYHITHGEANEAPMTIVLGIIVSFIAWIRYKKIPIKDRPTLASITDNRQ